MTLGQYFKSIPLNQRVSKRKQLAKLTNRTLETIYHWSNGTRKYPPAIAVIIERFTKGQVQKKDAWPKVFIE